VTEDYYGNGISDIIIYMYALHYPPGKCTHTHILINIYRISYKTRVFYCTLNIIYYKSDKNGNVPMFLLACMCPYSLLRSSAETMRPPPQQHKIIAAVRMSCCCLAMISSVGSDGVTLSVYACV